MKVLVVAKGRVILCGSCVDTRGINEGELMEVAGRSTMDELTAVTIEAGNVLVT